MMNLEALSELPILDEVGVPRPVSELWTKTSVMVVFVRHFGCIFCRQQLIELREIIPQIERAGIRLAVIGNGTPNFIRGFREAVGQPSLAVYTDPTLATYAAAGLDRGHLATFDPRWAASGLKAFLGGHRQGATQGDVFQLGGVLIFAKGGRIVFRQASRFAGDHASPAQILAATATAEPRGDTNDTSRPRSF